MWYRKSICNQDTIGKSRFMFFASKTKERWDRISEEDDLRMAAALLSSSPTTTMCKTVAGENGNRDVGFSFFFLDSQFGKNLKQKAGFVEEESRCHSRTSPSPEKRKNKQSFWLREDTAVLGQGGSEIYESSPHRKSTWSVASWQKLKKIITRVIPPYANMGLARSLVQILSSIKKIL